MLHHFSLETIALHRSFGSGVKVKLKETRSALLYCSVLLRFRVSSATAGSCPRWQLSPRRAVARWPGRCCPRRSRDVLSPHGGPLEREDCPLNRMGKAGGQKSSRPGWAEGALKLELVVGDSGSIARVPT